MVSGYYLSRKSNIIFRLKTRRIVDKSGRNVQLHNNSETGEKLKEFRNPIVSQKRGARTQMPALLTRLAVPGESFHWKDERGFHQRSLRAGYLAGTHSQHRKKIGM